MKRKWMLLGFALVVVNLQASWATDRALLIGVSEYPNLAKEQWLQGPVHDVALVEGVLTSERLGFSTKIMQMLSGCQK